MFSHLGMSNTNHLLHLVTSFLRCTLVREIFRPILIIDYQKNVLQLFGDVRSVHPLPHSFNPITSFDDLFPSLLNIPPNTLNALRALSSIDFQIIGKTSKHKKISRTELIRRSLHTHFPSCTPQHQSERGICAEEWIDEIPVYLCIGVMSSFVQFFIFGSLK
jgi:hypothetical protein